MATEWKDLPLAEAEEPEAKERHSEASAMLRVKEVADLLGIHPNTVRIWTDSGVLTSYRIGPRRDRRIPIAAVRLLLESEHTEAPLRKTI